MFNSSIFRKVIFVIVSIILTYTIVSLFSSISIVNSYVQQSFEQNALNTLNKMEVIVKNVYYDLELYKEKSIERYKKRLKNVTETLWSTTLAQIEPGVSEELQKEKIKKLVRNARYNGNGYFWIINMNYNVIMHPIYPFLEGQNIQEYSKTSDDFKLNEVKLLKDYGDEKYVRYKITSNKGAKVRNKLSYLKLYKNWDWVLGTGIYIEDELANDIKKREDELKEQLQKDVEHSKIGKTGYFFIFDGESNVIIHPNDELKGVKLKDYINSNTNNNFFQDFKEASKDTSKPIKYKWSKLSDKKNFKYEKYAWIKYIPELDWYIGATIYSQDYKILSNKIATLVIFVTVLMLFITLFASYIFVKRFTAPIEELSEFAKKVTMGDYSTRSVIKRDDEIGELAQNLNIMVDTIEDNVENLQEKIDIEIEKNKRSLEQLFRSEKLSAMKEMIGNIAHHWRQPLSVITIYASSMKMNIKVGKEISQDQLSECADTVMKQANYLTKTIDDFKDFIKGENLIRTTSAVKIVNKTVNLIQSSLMSNYIRLIREDGEDVQVRVSDNDIIQALINVINNSIDAIKKNIKIDEEHRYIFISTKDTHNGIDIIIKDNGGGISQESLNKIFDPYFSTKNSSVGTGVGLSVVHNIIEDKYNGKIQVFNEEFTYENTKCKGLCFVISLKNAV